MQIIMFVILFYLQLRSIAIICNPLRSLSNGQAHHYYHVVQLSQMSIFALLYFKHVMHFYLHCRCRFQRHANTPHARTVERAMCLIIPTSAHVERGHSATSVNVRSVPPVLLNRGNDSLVQPNVTISV